MRATVVDKGTIIIVIIIVSGKTAGKLIKQNFSNSDLQNSLFILNN